MKPEAGDVTVPHAPEPPRQQLAGHVLRWRRRLSPDEFPGLAAGQGRSRRKRCITQEQAAILTGYTSGWYGQLERGDEHANYSDDFLNRTAYALRLNPEEKILLFLLATGHPPKLPENSSPMTVTAALQSLLDVQPWPAYINDEAWDVVAYNEHMSKWFPWVAGHENNIMRWVFTYPEARQQLHRWSIDWGPLMLAQLRFAHARMPGNERLTQILTEILEKNSDARRFWDEQLTYMHPDGDHRSLYLPCHGDSLQPIELIALEPLRAPGARLMMFMPLDAAARVYKSSHSPRTVEA